MAELGQSTRTRAGSAPSSTRRRRGSLRPEDIVSAAVGVIESRGLATLTMPAVAAAVGAPTTSVYWHFRTRDDLLIAVAERITAEFFSSLPKVEYERAWEDEILDYFTAFRHQLLEHPAFLELFTSRARTLLADPTINDLINDRLEAELGLLVRAGASPKDAYRIYNVFSIYVRGYVTVELAAQREQDQDGHSAANGWRRQPDARAHPIMAALPDAEPAVGGSPEQFQLGLRLLVDGARAQLGSAR